MPNLCSKILPIICENVYCPNLANKTSYQLFCVTYVKGEERWWPLEGRVY